VSDPLFSVIVPTYDRGPLLAEAVSSVLAQTVRDFEVLVVDDASPRPPDVPADPRVRVIRRAENGGPAAARNTGLDAARGRYVAFLDDDDVWRPGRLAIAAEGLRRAPVALCWDDFLDGGRGGHRVLEGDVADTILDATTPQLGATAIVRASCPRFVPRYAPCEDVEWWLRVAAAHRVTTVPEVGLLYRRHATPRHRTDLASRIAGSLALLEDHAGWFAAHPRAAAFRWKRVGLMALQHGDRRLARAALARSLRLHPTPRTAWHLARAVGPSRAA
jgi:glycosyltransferase involved in cell wall biosynthesis